MRILLLSLTRLAPLLLLCTALATGPATSRDYPDHEMTPGVRNSSVTQQNIKSTICKAGWTKTIRPSSSFIKPLKLRQIDEYGYADKNAKHYEEDHLISLQLGGHPTDEKNLWPQPYDLPCGARIKDVLETRLKKMVCAGKIKLRTAQRLIAVDWIDAYQRHVNADGCRDADDDDEEEDD